MNFERPNEEDAESLESPRRRDFLKRGVGGALAAVAGGAFLGHPLKEVIEEKIRPEGIQEELDECLRQLQEIAGLEVDFNKIEDFEKINKITSKELSLVERRDAVRVIVKCLQVYPTSYIKALHLDRIKLVKEYIEGEPGFAVVGGLVTKDDLHSLTISKEPAFSEVLMFKGLLGWLSDATVEGTFHHELYHIADEHRAYRNSFNEAWKKESVENGSLSYFDVTGLEAPPENGIKGFASLYGRSSPSEDRAEIAKHLFVDPDPFPEDDKALLKKVEKIKEEYFHRSQGVMDEGYWNVMRQHDIEATKQYVAAREKILGLT
mgnify:CR=1 FL=1